VRETIEQKREKTKEKMKRTFDFIAVHNDDMIPLKTYEGITLYRIDYESALRRENEFTQRLINKNDEE